MWSSATVCDLRTVRFLLTNGASVARDVEIKGTVGELKEALLVDWPPAFPRPDFISSVRFIMSGSFLDNDAMLEDVFKSCTTNRVTVHVVIKQSLSTGATASARGATAAAPAAATAATEAAPTATQQDEGESSATANASMPRTSSSPFLRTLDNGDQVLNEEAYFHFHGCNVDEDEVEKLRVVFRRQANPETNLMPFERAHSFLRTYWRFAKSRAFIDQSRAFPSERVRLLRQRVLRNADAIGALTFDQFLELYFLFDNETPEVTCPHGRKERVLRSTLELHRSLVATPPSLSAASSARSSRRGSQSSEEPAPTATTDAADAATSGDAPPLRVTAEVTSEAAVAELADTLDEQMFEDVFASVDADGDGVLSCKEVDLCYYMYASKLLLKLVDEEKEEEEVAEAAP